MLSHFALLWNARASGALVPPLRNDVFLSILPLAHAFERTVGYYLPMMGGSTVAPLGDLRRIWPKTSLRSPTALLGVPLVFEAHCASILAKQLPRLSKEKVAANTSAIGWRPLPRNRDAARSRRYSCSGSCSSSWWHRQCSRPWRAAACRG
jgi:long-chain acyl-CoA synthetase